MARRERRKMRRFEVVELWITRLVVWFIIFLVFFPMVSVVTASLQTGDVFFSQTLLPDPSRFTLENYRYVLQETRFPIWIRNTVRLAVMVGIIQLALTVTASYAFSRLKFFGRKNGIRVLLLLQMMPSFVTLVAFQFILFKAGIANLFGLMLVFAGAGAWNIWLLKGYIDGIPKELDEAAKVDGCTDWQVFWRIVLPLSKPMMAVMFLWSFMGIYSEFVMASAILRNPDDYLLAQGLKLFSENQFSTQWGRFSAAVIMSVAPIAAIWMFAQKYVESGLTRGAVKG